MAKIIHGDRIAKEAKLSVGCAAVIFDEGRERILITRRTDNGRWCLPGGRLDPGETLEECCVREVWEETGLHVRITRLIGVYSSPHYLVEYADGNRVQIIASCFEAEITGGEMGLSNETTDIGFFTLAEIEAMDLMESHRIRIADALKQKQTSFIR